MPIDPHFLPHMQRLVDNMSSGCFNPLEVGDPQTSAPVVYCDEENKFDHFKLHIPYAGYKLVWEVRFDSNCPEQAPDFLFDDDAFTLFLNADILHKQVSNLDHWDTKNSECLTAVVQQLLSTYTFFQINRLERDGSSLPDEIAKVVQEFELGVDQYQLLAGNSPVSTYFCGSSTRPPSNTVSLLFLHLERQAHFEEISEAFREMNLHFLFREYSPTEVSFYISPVLGNILGDKADFEIPNYAKSDGLSKYFGHFFKILNETMTQVIQGLQKRQEFHLSLLYELQESEIITFVPLENDNSNFTSSSYMVEIEDFPVVIIAQTPVNSFGDPRVIVKTMSGNGFEINTESMWDTKTIVDAVIEKVSEIKEANCLAIG